MSLNFKHELLFSTVDQPNKKNLSFCSIVKEDIQQYVEPLLTNLFKAFTLPGSAENEYIMKGKQ